MHKIKGYIGYLMILILAITGCQSNVEQSTSKVVKGCYVEEVLRMPTDAELVGFNRSYDGRILAGFYRKDNVLIYALKEDGTWEEINRVSVNRVKGVKHITSDICEKSVYILEALSNGKLQIEEYFADGTVSKELVLDENTDSYTDSVRILKAKNGDYFIQKDWDGELVSIDGKTGRLKDTLSKEVLSFNLVGDKVVYNTAWDEAKIYTYNIESGKRVNSVPYNALSNTNCVDADEEGIYLFNANGIQYLNASGEVWQEIVPADRNKLADATNGIALAFALNSDCFIVIFNDLQIMKYQYDAEAEDIINAEITVAMDSEHRLIRKVLAIYQEQHKDVKINIEYYAGQDGIHEELLNTQLLAGGGPDLLILDSLPIDNYIKKGLLVDLSDIAKSYSEEERSYSNVINTFTVDGHVYAIPIRFQVPMIWGKSEIVNNAHSLEALAAYKKAHPDEVLFNKNQYEMAMQFYPICAPLLKDEKGIVSLDKVKRYLECLEIVSEDKESIKTQSECISMESPKYSELLDYVEGKANTFILAPRNILDIAKAAAILKAREEKGDVVPLEVNGQIVYILSGIMGINSNSKHQDIVKEVITIALGKGVQEEASYEGLSLNERDVNRQGYFAKGIAGTTIQDDTGRSVKIDSEAEEIYNKCKAYWKEASLYCDKRDKSSTELIKKVVIPSIESGKPTSSYLEEFETVINLQNEEQGTIESK